MSQTTVIFDLDNTLLDSQMIKQKMRQQAKEKFGITDKIFDLYYEQARGKLFGGHEAGTKNFISIHEVCRNIANYLRIINKDITHLEYEVYATIFASIDFKKCLLPGARDIVQEYRDNRHHVYLITAGDWDVQETKILGSGLSYLFEEDHTRITPDKSLFLKNFIRQQFRETAKPVLMFDDDLWLLYNLHENFGDKLHCVFIEYGRHAIPAEGMDLTFLTARGKTPEEVFYRKLYPECFKISVVKEKEI